MFVQKLLFNTLECYLRTFKPIIVGVKAILIKDGKVVLVKHTYQEEWHLPGGALKRRETIRYAVEREIREELAGSLNDYYLFGLYSDLSKGKNGHIIVFLSNDFTFKIQQNFEIEKVEQFDLNDLPDTVSAPTRRRLEEYRSGKVHLVGDW
jgi:ADP-ribose pyrophosphatase YjhB (NUDIX family)